MLKNEPSKRDNSTDSTSIASYAPFDLSRFKLPTRGEIHRTLRIWDPLVPHLLTDRSDSMKARSLDIWLRCGHKAMTILTGGAIAAFTISSTAVTFNAIGLDFPLVGFNVGVMAASSGLAVLFWNFATSIYDYRLERIGKLHNEKCSQAK